ncbi:CIC11C00000001956 [Sungouiella intermedia]|uniref:CIC11C00000001956 n=2 Tax=Sungouiella intermedia TaxID=45354 RepID=A0A1L0DP64_9ASCO|nr:CIC11C00000001956 [[Candida] intermedia]
MTEGHSRDAKEGPTRSNDFSDIVHGEDIEFRGSRHSAISKFHRISILGKLRPPNFIKNMSETQLITIAGASSGFLAGIVVCPLDVVKTRVQALGTNSRYQGFIGAFKTIAKEEGIRGLYRGVVPVMVGYLPTWAIYFSVYERAKHFYPDFFKKHFGLNVDWLNHFAASMTAGASSSFLVNPVWVVKTRLMIQTGSEKVYYNGTIDAFRKMYANEGFKVFYSGFVPSLFGLIHVGIHFPVYEALKKTLHVNNMDETSHLDEFRLWRLIVASAFSKMIASTITYPHEILRTRMQMQTTRKRTLVGEVGDIYKKEGLRGFYAGYMTNLARTVPASAVTLVSFEYIKTYLLEISGKMPLH